MYNLMLFHGCLKLSGQSLRQALYFAFIRIIHNPLFINSLPEPTETCVMRAAGTASALRAQGTGEFLSRSRQDVLVDSYKRLGNNYPYVFRTTQFIR